MSSNDGEASPATENSILSHLLDPGSSLHPTLLSVLDGAFACLFLVLTALAYLTSGNPHIFALMGIELCLWASVKWFVNEMKNSLIESKKGS